MHPPPQRVLLVNPRSTYVNEIAQKVFPPVNLLYLAASLSRRGHHPKVLEANAWSLSDDELARRARGFRPHVVGLPLYTDILAQVRDMTERLSAAWPDASIVLGGPHPSSWPRRTLDQFPRADVVLRGEAEHSLTLLCEKLAAGEPIHDVPGVVYRDNQGRPTFGADQEFPDVNDLPLPARELVDDAYRHKRYYTLMVRDRPVESLISSRGCPFSCGFCYNFRHHYRFRTPEAVLDELVRIRDRGLRDVEICDDTFTVNKRRAMKIFDLIIKEKLDISFRIKSRVDVFSEELAKRGAEAGVYMASFGMESGSERMLEVMRKRTRPEMNARAAALCRKYGMLCHSSWLVGYPGETPESVGETLDQIRAIKPSTVNIGVLRPYPATHAYELARHSGDLVGDWHPDAHEPPWVRLPWAQDKEVLEDLMRRMMRKVYFSPHYIGSFAYQMVKGANITLARYAVQETMKLARARVDRLPGR